MSRFTISAALLVVAVLFGGGGAPSPLAGLVVQLAALLALAAWFVVVRVDRSDHPLDWALLAGGALFAAVPLIQLVPLPPGVWQALPGRETELDALRLVGAESSWRPISLTPYRTLASALALIPPLVVLFFVSRLDPRDRTRLLGLVAALACLSALVGAIQLSSGNAHWLRFYPGTTHYAFATGLHANRNAAADLFAIGVLALATFLSIRSELISDTGRRAVAGAVAAFLLVTVLLTGSRAGLGAAALAVVVGGYVFMRRFKVSWRAAALGLGGVLVASSLFVVVMRDNPVVQKSLDRLNSFQDARPDLWEDTRYAIAQSWPVGTGMGSFVPVIQGAERLEVVDLSRPNRAHNDYLEFTLEAGLLGWVVIAGLALALAVRVWSVLRASQTQLQQRRHAVFALGVLLIISLHSIVDYPLRSMSLATICALAIGLFSRAGNAKAARSFIAPDALASGRADGEVRASV